MSKVVFIDANQYLYLYKITKGKLFLAPLQEHQEYLFVTEQIVQEVERNKLQVAADFLAMQFEQLKVRSFDVPDHLLDISGELETKLREQLREIGDKIKETNKQLMNAAVETLRQISQSTDRVSNALEKIFKRAVTPTPKELQKARERKEKGNPPGKNENPLGDQLTWEQIISHCQQWSQLWIITDDRDYGTLDNSELLLNPFLYNELLQQNPKLEIHCFKKLLAGLQHFTKTIGADLNKQITPADIEEIKKEEKSLPPWGWSQIGSMPPEAHRSHAFYTIVNSWYPGMVEPAGRFVTDVSNPGFTVLPGLERSNILLRLSDSEKDKNK
jgi:PIN domain